MAGKRGSGKGGAIVVIAIGLFWAFHSISNWFDSLGGDDPVLQATASEDIEESNSEMASVSPDTKPWPPLDESSAATASDLSASNYYIVLDGSGSMERSKCSAGSTKIAAALSALSHFVGTVPAAANLGFTAFDDNDISERVALATNNREAFAAALRKVKAGGGTPLRSSIELGYQKLTAQAQRQLGYGEYHLVVVTDGNPDPSSEDPTDIVEQILVESPVVLHTIGFCIGTDHVLNQPGRTFYMAADNPAQLDQGLASVLAEAPSFDPASFGE